MTINLVSVYKIYNTRLVVEHIEGKKTRELVTSLGIDYRQDFICIRHN
jgi:EAL domain-containing protein (putative c-di-GMP-specific phosphodiesterase class I)